MIIPSKRLNTSIGPIDGNLIGCITPDQGCPESNGTEEVLHITVNLRLKLQMQFNESKTEAIRCSLI